MGYIWIYIDIYYHPWSVYSRIAAPRDSTTKSLEINLWHLKMNGFSQGFGFHLFWISSFRIHDSFCGAPEPTKTIKPKNFKVSNPQEWFLFSLILLPKNMVEESLREEWGYQPTICKPLPVGVSTHLKNISQNGNLPQVGVNMKHIWNHHLEFIPVDALISSHNSGLLLQTLASRLFIGDHPRLLVKVIDSGKENIKACPKLKFEQPISIRKYLLPSTSPSQILNQKKTSIRFGCEQKTTATASAAWLAASAAWSGLDKTWPC